MQRNKLVSASVTDLLHIEVFAVIVFANSATPYLAATSANKLLNALNFPISTKYSKPIASLKFKLLNIVYASTPFSESFSIKKTKEFNV